ncbi:MAG: helix-turn-helix domain-containing protein [Chlamydiota bacterium]|nr:helix-turn-helix domain-containing protein [Chlamydiota bacterium]
MDKLKENHGAPSLLSVSDAARYLGVSPSTVRRWERENKISSVRTPGGHRRFSVEDLQSLYKNSTQNGITFS